MQRIFRSLSSFFCHVAFQRCSFLLNSQMKSCFFYIYIFSTKLFIRGSCLRVFFENFIESNRSKMPLLRCSFQNCWPLSNGHLSNKPILYCWSLFILYTVHFNHQIFLFIGFLFNTSIFFYRGHLASVCRKIKSNWTMILIKYVNILNRYINL